MYRNLLDEERLKINPLFSSKSNEWSTPDYFFNALDAEFHFTLDPCATIENHKCLKYYTKEDDGLSKDWFNDIVFMNPPYGRDIRYWIEKAYRESINGATVVCLIPARTDTLYWHNYVSKASEIRFVKGRLKFGKGEGCATFPSAVVIFNDTWYTRTEFKHIDCK